MAMSVRGKIYVGGYLKLMYTNQAILMSVQNCPSCFGSSIFTGHIVH